MGANERMPINIVMHSRQMIGNAPLGRKTFGQKAFGQKTFGQKAFV
jgi:hypothetical protein